MIVCGVKLTHDGGIALIDDGKLVFSVEMEKIGNAERHAPIHDLADVFDTVARYGYRPQDIDLVAVDGWFNHERNRKWQGRDVRIQNAPYRRGILSDDPLQEYRYRIWDLDWCNERLYRREEQRTS